MIAVRPANARSAIIPAAAMPVKAMAVQAEITDNPGGKKYFHGPLADTKIRKIQGVSEVDFEGL